MYKLACYGSEKGAFLEVDNRSYIWRKKIEYFDNFEKINIKISVFLDFSIGLLFEIFYRLEFLPIYLFYQSIIYKYIFLKALIRPHSRSFFQSFKTHFRNLFMSFRNKNFAIQLFVM